MKEGTGQYNGRRQVLWSQSRELLAATSRRDRTSAENILISYGRPVTIRTLSFGGDRTGALLLSKYIRPGTVSDVPYNHYSLLKSLEEIFGIHHYLGYAGQTGLVAFGPDVFTNHR